MFEHKIGFITTYTQHEQQYQTVWFPRTIFIFVSHHCLTVHLLCVFSFATLLEHADYIGTDPCLNSCYDEPQMGFITTTVQTRVCSDANRARRGIRRCLKYSLYGAEILCTVTPTAWGFQKVLGSRRGTQTGRHKNVQTQVVPSNEHHQANYETQ